MGGLQFRIQQHAVDDAHIMAIPPRDLRNPERLRAGLDRDDCRRLAREIPLQLARPAAPLLEDLARRVSSTNLALTAAQVDRDVLQGAYSAH
jgi:hypothetical protein